jgi:hypothetical protein
MDIGVAARDLCRESCCGRRCTATLFGSAGLIWVGLWVTAFFPVRAVIVALLIEVAVISGAAVINTQHLRMLIHALETWLGRADKLMYVAKAATKSPRMRHVVAVA